MVAESSWENNELYIKYEGIITNSDLTFANNIVGNSKFEDLKYVISDFSLVHTIGFDRDHLYKKVALDNSASRWNNNLWQIMITSNNVVKTEVEYYIGEMLNHDNEWSFLIVDSLAEARKIILNVKTQY